MLVKTKFRKQNRTSSLYKIPHITIKHAVRNQRINKLPCRQLMGELSGLTLKDLQKLESQLDSSLQSVRAKKVCQACAFETLVICHAEKFSMQIPFWSFTLSRMRFSQDRSANSAARFQDQPSLCFLHVLTEL